MDIKQIIPNCPEPESEKWGLLSKEEQEQCKKESHAINTSKFMVFNSLNMIVIAIIGGFVFAFALLIIEPLKTEFQGFSIYWFALILFGIIISFAVLQYYLEKEKKKYQQLIE